MLIPPSYFYEKKWLRTATNSHDLLKFIGISRSTYERLWKGEGHCSKKTHTKLAEFAEGLKRKLGLAGRPIGWCFDLKRPWRTFFSDLIPDAVDLRDHKLSYAIHVMLQVEDALFAFGQQYREHKPQTTSLFLAMGLPDGILPREIETHLAELVAAQGRGLPRPSYPAWMGKAILRTFLFALAAWEVTILRAKTYVANTEPFFHKCLPKMVCGKPALPIRLFLEGIQERYGLPINEDFALFIEVSTRDNSGSEPQESALRQIQEWKCGNVMPGFETIKNLAFKLAPTGERQQLAIAISYIKNRFIQEIYAECAHSIKASPQQFADKNEVVEVFQEYPNWYAFHEVHYDVWAKQGATQP
jgi:transcriptional regulator with XRE-family HTH domain